MVSRTQLAFALGCLTTVAAVGLLQPVAPIEDVAAGPLPFCAQAKRQGLNVYLVRGAWLGNSEATVRQDHRDGLTRLLNSGRMMLFGRDGNTQEDVYIVSGKTAKEALALFDLSGAVKERKISLTATQWAIDGEAGMPRASSPPREGPKMPPPKPR
ncbi:MAG: hypothetical protein JNM85_00115 [Chthonomonas sp.]|nr:hypothetical protein [Chthonomonas sp.]